MPRYRVLIHARNFHLQLGGQSEKFGFYTHRFVEAPDAAAASAVAIEDFRCTTRYLDLLECSLNADHDPPILGAEKTEELPVQQDPVSLLSDTAFYRE